MKFPKIIEKYISGKQYALDQVGLSGSGVCIFEDMVLKIQPESEESINELEMLRWLNGKIPVPRIIEHIREDENSFILMSKCPGRMSCDERYMQDPKRQAELLAEALHTLWEIPVGNCPCKWPLERRLQIAAKNIAQNHVDVNGAQSDTFGSSGFRDPEALLQWLIDHKPEEQQMLSHGDFCLPNIILNKNGLSGLIDLGKAGIADPWQDIALCIRSLSNNYSGMYGGRSYPGFSADIFFQALGIQPDWDRIRYYILLDEIF